MDQSLGIENGANTEQQIISPRLEQLRRDDAIKIPPPERASRIAGAGNVEDKQLLLMSEEYCRMVSVAPGLQRKLGIMGVMPPPTIPEQASWYKQLVQERLTHLERGLHEAGIATFSSNPLTGEELSESSLLRYYLALNQNDKSKMLTPEQLQALIAEKEHLLEEDSERKLREYEPIFALSNNGDIRNGPIDELNNQVHTLKLRKVLSIRRQLSLLRDPQDRYREDRSQVEEYEQLPQTIEEYITAYEQRVKIRVPEFDLESGEELGLGSEKRLAYAIEIAEGRLVLTPELLRNQRERVLRKSMEVVQGETPFAHREVFDPREALSRCKVMGSKERREEYAHIIEKMRSQKAGWTKMREWLIYELYHDADISRDEYENYILQYQSVYAFPPEQCERARGYFDQLQVRKESVQAFRESHPSTAEATRALFGKEYRGKLEYSPFCITFSCSTNLDYDLLVKIPQSEGVLFTNNNIPQLRDAVSVIRPSGSVETKIHEEQHSLYRLFHLSSHDTNEEYRQLGELNQEYWNQKYAKKPLTQRLRESWDKVKTRITGREEPKTLRPEDIMDYFTMYLHSLSDMSLERAKDEALAYFKDGGLRPEEVIAYQTEQGGLYDYLAFYREELPRQLNVLGEPYMLVARQKIQQVLVDTRQLQIKKNLPAIYALEKAGYSKEEAVGLLTPIPFRKWAREVKRLLPVEEAA